MKKLSLCFIDSIGMSYSGNSVYERGLGGAESAIIYLGEELTSLGFDVTVYNHCESPGVYKNVEYLDIKDIRKNEKVFDILISSRSILPLAPQTLGHEIWKSYEIDIGVYENITQKAKLKIVWMHDTRLQGEEYLEPLLVSNDIQEVFLLSDWHSSNICGDGRWQNHFRNYDVIKRHIFQTRNGVKPYSPLPSIMHGKDPNLFIYSSSANKGLIPLLENIWPEIKVRIPEAKLVIIGGYYEGADKWFKETYLEKANKFGKDPTITFTGIVTQKEVSEILCEATFMIYPPQSPETYGISIIEAFYYNVVVLSSRFGAIEQTAIEEMSYLTDYNIDHHEGQVSEFVDMVVSAHTNVYITQQKQYACDEIREWILWDGVALQWKKHFYNLLDLIMSREEAERARLITSNVNRLFKTRNINLEDQVEFFPPKPSKRIVVVTPVFNSFEYIEKCIMSVALQFYDNYIQIIVDDCSTDGTVSKVKEVISNLPENLRSKFILLENSVNVGALANQCETIMKYADADDIIALLDGDDWLYNDPDIFTYINSLYPENSMSYGSCWSLADKIPLITQDYPEEVKLNKQYRRFKFNWGIPYTHLRTFSGALFEKVDKDFMKNDQGEYYKAGGDNALMFGLLEVVNPNEIKAVKRLLVNYNDLNPINDYKINYTGQTDNQEEIVNKVKAIVEDNDVIESSSNRILIAMPTAKYIEPETFKSIYELAIPNGYESHFQFFYGYNIAQIRNIIADYAIKRNYDYVFWVDSDIVLPSDALWKLHAHQEDYISGVYVQRKMESPTPEVYLRNAIGGVSNVDIDYIREPRLIEVAATGFGCVLTTKKLLQTIGDPQFEYTNAINFDNIVSEDVDFCLKASQKGYTLYADTSIKCDHIGSYTYKI